MKCWKCGQELTDGTSVCIYCGVAQSRPTPVTEAGRAMRALYDRYGAQVVLTNGAYLTNGLGDVMEDSKKLRNQLRMAMDAGVGRAYLEQLNIGAPDGDFDCRVRILLTEEAGLSDKAGAELVCYFDEMIGWHAASKPKPPTYTPPRDADKIITTGDVGQISERPYTGGRSYEENRYGEESEPGPREYPSNEELRERLRDTTKIYANRRSNVHLPYSFGRATTCEEFQIYVQKDTRMIVHITHGYESRLDTSLFHTKSAVEYHSKMADNVESLTRALCYGKVEMNRRRRGKFCCVHELYLEDMPQLKQAGVIRFVHVDKEYKHAQQYEIIFCSYGDVFAEQLEQSRYRFYL